MFESTGPWTPDRTREYLEERTVPVRGSAEVTPSPDEDRRLLRELATRYLGGTGSALADRLLSADREEVSIRLGPDRVHAWDYSERMRDALARAEGTDEGNGG